MLATGARSSGKFLSLLALLLALAASPPAEASGTRKPAPRGSTGAAATPAATSRPSPARRKAGAKGTQRGVRPRTSRAAVAPRAERVERFIELLATSLKAAGAEPSAAKCADVITRAAEEAQLSPSELRSVAGEQLIARGQLPAALQRPGVARSLRAAIAKVTGLPPRVSAKSSKAAYDEAIEFLDRQASLPPAHRGNRISKDSYVSLTAMRVKDADLVWVNRRLMADLGIPLPNGKLSPRFVEKFLDTFAVAVPPGGDTRGFVKGTEREVFGDLYGGEGVWGTRGSGRATTITENFQLKGGGDTGLSEQDIGKKKGTMDPVDALYEPIYGEVNATELPHGGDSGRYLAVFTFGSKKNPRMAAVRWDPVRPGHFMWSELDRKYDIDGDRFKATLGMLENALPAAKGERTDMARATRITLRLRQYTRQLAEQYGTAYVKRLYHGGTSASNAQTNGGWLDYALETAQPGYGAINTLYSEASSREWHVVRRMLVDDFARDVAGGVEGMDPKEIERLGSLFDTNVQTTIERRFVELAGFPAHRGKIVTHPATRRALGATIARIASVPLNGNHRAIHVGPQHGSDAKTGGFMPERTNEFDINGVLQTLAKNAGKSEAQQDAAIAGDLPDRGLRKALVSEYRAVYAEAAAEASRDGVTPRAFARLIAHRARVLNEPMPQVYRPQLQDAIVEQLGEFKKTGKTDGLGELIDRTAVESRRTHTTGRYQVVLSTKFNAKTGAISQRVYDAVSDKVFVR